MISSWYGQRGEEKLLEFLKNIINFHDTIKFTFDWSRDCINYLDVQVIKKGGVMETDLYTKPTVKYQYLYHTSCHPKGCKRSIPYSQALSLKRICSTPALFENRAKELTHFLVARGYQYKFVCDQIQKVRSYITAIGELKVPCTVKVTDAMFATMLFPVVVSRATQPRDAIT